MREITSAEFEILQGHSPITSVEEVYEEHGGVVGLWQRSIAATMIEHFEGHSFQSYYRVELIGNQYKVTLFEMLVDLRKGKDNQYFNLNILAKSTPDTVVVGVKSFILAPPPEICEEWLSDIAWKRGRPVYVSNLVIGLQYSTTCYYTGLLIKEGRNVYDVLETKQLPAIVYDDEPTISYIKYVTCDNPKHLDPRVDMSDIMKAYPSGRISPRKIDEVLEIVKPRAKHPKPRPKRTKKHHKRK